MGIGIDVTYAWIDTQVDGGDDVTTRFLRPGADATAALEIPLSDSVLVDVGWTSFFFPHKP